MYLTFPRAQPLLLCSWESLGYSGNNKTPNVVDFLDIKTRLCARISGNSKVMTLCKNLAFSFRSLISSFLTRLAKEALFLWMGNSIFLILVCVAYKAFESLYFNSLMLFYFYFYLSGSRCLLQMEMINVNKIGFTSQLELSWIELN